MTLSIGPGCNYAFPSPYRYGWFQKLDAWEINPRIVGMGGIEPPTGRSVLHATGLTGPLHLPSVRTSALVLRSSVSVVESASVAAP